MKVLLLAVVGLVVVVFVAAALYLTFGDLSRFQPNVEAAVSHATSRECRIGGEFKLKILPTPSLVVEGVTLANAEWGTPMPMISIGKASVEIHLWSLISGPIRVKKLEARDVAVLVEQNSSGMNNWNSGTPPPAVPPDIASQGPGLRELPAIIELASVDNVTVLVKQPNKDDVRGALARFDLRTEDTGVVIAEGDGQVGDRPFAVHGKIARAADRRAQIDLESTVKDAAVTVHALLGAHEIDFDGSLDDMSKLADAFSIEGAPAGNLAVGGKLITDGDGYELRDAWARLLGAEARGHAIIPQHSPAQVEVELSAADVETLGAGLPPMALKSSASARISLERIEVDPFSITLGDSDFTGSLVAKLGEALSLTVNGKSKVLDLRPFQEAKNGQSPAAKPEKSPATDENSKQGVFGEAELPFEALTTTQIDAKLSVAELRSRDAQARNVELALTNDGKQMHVAASLSAMRHGQTSETPFTLDASVVRADSHSARIGLKSSIATSNVSARILLSAKQIDFDTSVDDLRKLANAFSVTGLPAGALAVRGTLLKGRDRYELRDATATLRGAKVRMQAVIPQSGGGPIQAKVDLSTRDAARLHAGLPSVGLRSTATARISAGRIEVDPLNIEFGDSDFAGSMVARLGNALSLTVNGKSKVVDLRQFQEAKTSESSSTKRKESPVSRANGKREASGEDVLPFEVLTSTSIDAKVSIAELRTRNAQARNVELAFTGDEKEMHLTSSLDAKRRGEAGDTPFTLNATAERADGHSARFDLDSSIADSSVTAHGLVASQQIDFDASVDDVSKLAAAFSVKGVPTGSLAVGGKLIIDADQYEWRDATARFLGADARGQALIPQGGPVQVQVEVSAPDVATLSARLPSMALKSSATARIAPERIEVDPFSITMGDSDFIGSVVVARSESVSFSVNGKSKVIDLRPFQGTKTTESPPTEQEKPPATKKRNDKQRVFGEDKLPLDKLPTQSIDARLSIAELRSRDAQAQNVDLSLTNDGKQLHLLTSLDAEGGSLKGDAVLAVANHRADLDVDLNAQDLRINVVSGKVDDPSQIPPIGLSAKLRSSGSSPRELAAGANGHLLLTQGKGRIDSEAVGFLSSDVLAQIFSALNPFAKNDKYTNWECTVVGLNVVDGVATLDPMLAEAEKFMIIGGGQVDLKTEKLDIEFNTKPRKGVGISADMFVTPFVKIVGTLAQPGVGMNAKGTLLTGGAAAMTGGLSVLAKGIADRITAQRGQCVKSIREANAARAPAPN